MNLVNCIVCTFCMEKLESIEHLPFGCHIVVDIWHNLNSLISDIVVVYIEIQLNLYIAMFGLYVNHRLNIIKKIQIFY